MNPTTGQLLQSGLVITALGMGLVFASLTLLWALLRLLTSAFQDKPAPEISWFANETAPAERKAAVDASASVAAALTAERADVAAVVAGALLSNALPFHLERGRITPSWVKGNPARAVPSRPPLRATEQTHDPGRD